MISKCKWCGKLYLKKNNRAAYCSSRCREEAKRESKRNYINKRNKSEVYNTRIKSLTTLGSLGTSSTAKVRKSFDEELKSIRREKRRLGLI